MRTPPSTIEAHGHRWASPNPENESPTRPAELIAALGPCGARRVADANSGRGAQLWLQARPNPVQVGDLGVQPALGLDDHRCIGVPDHLHQEFGVCLTLAQVRVPVST